MSRKRKYDAHAGDRFAKLKATRAELAADYNLSENDPRIAQAALVKLNQQNWEAQILLGRAVPSDELSYTDIIVQLLGPPPTPLTVRFVYTCIECRKKSETDPPEPAPKEERSPLACLTSGRGARF